MDLRWRDLLEARLEGRPNVLESIYGGHPVFDVGGDVGGEQHFLFTRLKEKFGTAVRGIGHTTVFVAGQKVEDVVDMLIDLTYTLRKNTYKGAVMANRAVTAFVSAVKGGVNIDLEALQRRGGMRSLFMRG